MREHPSILDRRRMLLGSGAMLLGTSLLSGCDDLASKPWARKILNKDEDANLYVQRLLLSDRRLAPEFTEADISPVFKANGTQDPSDKTYKDMVKNGFKTFKLEIGGLVDKPLSLTLESLRTMPSRTQITRHDCVEGWSCIGKWTGVPLGDLLKQAGLKPQARFIVFYCADSMDEGDGLQDASDADDSEDDQESDDTSADNGSGDKTKQPASGGQTKPKTADSKRAQNGGVTPADKDDITADKGGIGSRYYESIDLEDAFHPQTILAYEMNGQPLPVAHGAPLRLRLERALGYKQAKYILQIKLVDTLDGIGKGGGGYWEDQGYEWYAGI